MCGQRDRLLVVSGQDTGVQVPVLRVVPKGLTVGVEFWCTPLLMILWVESVAMRMSVVTVL